MKKSVCSRTLLWVIWGVFLATVSWANPDQPNDRTAVLVDWIDYNLGVFVETAPFVSGDGTIDGNIEEVAFAVKADSSSPDPVDLRDYKILHMEVDLYSDAIIPLGLFRSGLYTLKYSNWGNHHFGGGEMEIVIGYNNLFVSRHAHNLSRVPKLRALWQGGGYYLYLQYDKYILTNGTYPRSNLLELTISIEGNHGVHQHYNLPYVADSWIVPEQEVVAIRGGTYGQGRTTFDREVWVGDSPVLTEASVAPIFAGFLGRGDSTSGAVLASGDNTIAAGKNAVAIGDSTFAMGEHSTAIGLKAAASAPHSLALGSHSRALAGGSMAMGWGAVASGGFSSASGAHSESKGDYSMAAGTDLVAYSRSEIALGFLNRFSEGDRYAWRPLDTLLTLGNGDAASGSRSNAIETLKNGRTTLTNKYWAATAPGLVPVDADASSGEALVVEGHTRLKGRVILEQPQGDISMGIFGNAP
ncbi:MAG: hypothetical protein AAGN66_07410 [Acidobacteriota bacterium]